jgi:hypothetical protein
MDSIALAVTLLGITIYLAWGKISLTMAAHLDHAGRGEVVDGIGPCACGQSARGDQGGAALAQVHDE